MHPFETFKRQRYSCDVHYCNDMGHFMTRIIWHQNPPFLSKNTLEKSVNDFVYKEAKTRTTEFFVKMPGQSYSTHHFSAKDATTKHRIITMNAEIYLTIHWEGSSREQVEKHARDIPRIVQTLAAQGIPIDSMGHGLTDGYKMHV